MIENIESVCLSIALTSEAQKSKLCRTLNPFEVSEEIQRFATSGNLDLEQIGAEEKKLQSLGISFFSYFNGAYPEQLRRSPTPPIGLFVKGEIPQTVKVAIVGARAASPSAYELSRKWARELSTKGICIVSGLALGVDGGAHLGSLESGQRGSTVAALAHGLDQVYPATHFGLANNIVKQGGALISEYPIGISPLKHHFLDRNRIIAGLCEVTILVQAAERSGALATVRHALEVNREVGVVPWDPNEKRGAGCLKLLREGAQMITSSQDILDLLPEYNYQDSQKRAANPIVEYLQEHGSASVQEIQNALGELIVNETTLIELELDNIVTRSGADLLTLAHG